MKRRLINIVPTGIAKYAQYMGILIAGESCPDL